jgi:hypothetical protein
LKEVSVRRRKLFRSLQCGSGGHFDLHSLRDLPIAAGVSFHAIEHSEESVGSLCAACCRFFICCWQSRLLMQMPG